MTDAAALAALVREIPDYPEPGIRFYDITTLLASPDGFRSATEAMSDPFDGVDKVVGVEARGFILAAPVAHQLGAGFVPVRKPGKLPGETSALTYDLEYGSDTLEIHSDAVGPDDRVLIVDDVLATGGTAEATVRLVAATGATIVGVSFLLELAALGGRQRLVECFDGRDVPIHSVIVYE